MWLVGIDPVEVYVGTTLVALRLPNGKVEVHHIEEFGAGLEIVDMALRTVALRHPVGIWLSGGICRPFLLGESLHLLKRDERIQVLSLLAEQWTGLDRPLAVWLEKPMAGSRMSVAVSRNQLEMIRSKIGFGSRRISFIRPWWAHALSEVEVAKTAERTLVGLHDSEALTMICGAADDFFAANTALYLSNDEKADATLRRCALSYGVAVDSIVHIRISEMANLSTVAQVSRFPTWWQEIL